MKRVQLKHCEILYTPDGARTYFPDGATVDAAPHPEMPHYHVIAHRCGYGDDVLAYCQEHEVCHAFVAEFFCARPSIVLWALAHKQRASPFDVTCEEALAQMVQRYVRANELPIIGDVDWGAARVAALDYLN